MYTVSATPFEGGHDAAAALGENDSDIQSGDDKKHSAFCPCCLVCFMKTPPRESDITKPQVTCNAATDPLSAAQTCQDDFPARQRQYRGVIDAHDDSRRGIKRQSADTRRMKC